MTIQKELIRDKKNVSYCVHRRMYTNELSGNVPSWIGNLQKAVDV